MSELHLACASGPDYVVHAAVMLHSATRHGGRPVVVHYLHGPEFFSSDKDGLKAMVESEQSSIVFHEIPDVAIQGLSVNPLFHPAVWYRVFLPDLLPDLERILYLDVDTIVVDRLDPLWEQPLDGCHLGAVTNVFMEYHRDHPAKLGIDLENYFNSGVLVLNLAAMRESNFTHHLLEVVRARDPLVWDDQDALNLVVGPRRLALHPRWNVMNSFVTRPQLAREAFGSELLQEALAKPAIRHFEGPGPNKPWHLLHEREGRNLYATHRAATPWPDLVLEGDTPRNRAKLLGARARGRVRALRSRTGRGGEHGN